MQVSPHFTLEELVRSQAALRLGIDNTPSEPVIANLQWLANEILEPVRSILGVPLHVDSGYRSPWLNQRIGGAFHSAHMDGRAADVIPIGMALEEAFLRIRAHTELPFDQLIAECGSWLHLGIAVPGVPPRREVLVCSGAPGNWTYTSA